MVGHADDDSRSLADCLWQQGKCDGAFLLLKIDVCDLVIILRDQVDSRAKMSETLLLMPAIWFERLFCTL